MDAGGAAVEQVPQVAPQQRPGEVVRLVAVLAVDDQPAHAARLEQRLEHLEVLEVAEHVLALVGRERLGRPVGILVERLERVHGVVGVARERVDGLAGRRHRAPA